jgi:hypothetical protein
MNDVPKLFNTVVQDFRDLDSAFNFANKSSLYLSKKKEWSFGDYLLIGFNVLNIGFRGYKTIYDTDKFFIELANPKPAATPIPARLYLPTQRRVRTRRKRQNLAYRRINGSI